MPTGWSLPGPHLLREGCPTILSPIPLGTQLGLGAIPLQGTCVDLLPWVLYLARTSPRPLTPLPACLTPPCSPILSRKGLLSALFLLEGQPLPAGGLLPWGQIFP